MKYHPTDVQIGLFGIGLETYWPQFAGLQERLLGYLERINVRLRSIGQVVDLGLVDSPSSARWVGEGLTASNPDVVFLYVSTYALSSTVLPVVQRLSRPVVILNLQPEAQLDYAAFNALGDRGLMTGKWLEYCQSCSVPEIACVFERAGIPFRVVSGYLDEEAAWQEISDWVDAARVARAMRENRVGLFGHYYSGMLDVYSDLTQQSAVFGNHFEHFEIEELIRYRENLAPDVLAEKLAQFHRDFVVSPECEPSELERAARTSCALDQVVKERDLGSMAYYFEGEAGHPSRDLATSVIAGNTLLTGRKVPVAGEYEIKNVQAMKILDLYGAGGSFSELYLTDFKDDVVFLGHDGPAHFAMAEGPVGLVPLTAYHGKPGRGLSIQMSVKHGPVTLLSVVQKRNGQLFFLIAEGESVAGPILQIGNTNSRYRFPGGAKQFMNRWVSNGPAHHCAIGLGHLGAKLRKLANILDIEIVSVT
jgi:L-arabinose isomerase